MSARNRLRAALAAADEPTLAESLRISIASLRRYASGEMKMNWVISTRLAMFEQQRVISRAPRTAPARTARRRTTHRPTPHGQQVAVVV